MKRHSAALGVGAGLLLLLAPAWGQAGKEAAPEAYREAVRRAVPLLEKGSAGYIRQRGCFSCHHQAVPVLALRAAQARGLAVDAPNVEAQVRHTETDLRGNIGVYRDGRGQGGGSVRAGYALWTLAAGEWKPDETTAAVAGFLLKRDETLGYWRTSANRPPSEASSFASTFVSLQALQAYALEKDRELLASRTAKAREWLLSTPARDTEDRVFRLWSLKLAGAEAEAVAKAAAELLGTQREDGGWGQLADMGSDAYATGSALVALHEAGGLSPADPAYKKGLSHLVRTQQADGSWLVASRSKPFQPYFESGFPHGKDQWISCAATGWAVWALTLGLPPKG